jgi:Ca2+/Na+ antiporter
MIFDEIIINVKNVICLMFMMVDNLNIIDLFWTILWILISCLLIYLSIVFFKEEKQLKKTGKKTIAKVVNFSEEKIMDNDKSLSKISVYEFYDSKQNLIRVKSKTNRTGKIGEKCVIYYNIDNPEKEYYLEKDYLRKYILLSMGLFFLIFGLFMLERELHF